MRAYWYWPFLRDELLALARAFPHDADELVVHAMAGRVDPVTARGPGWRVDATLPTLAAHAEGTPAWLASRTRTYVAQVRTRRNAVRAGAFDVAHVMFLNYFLDAFALQRLARDVPLVVTVHDVVPHQQRVLRRVERALLRRQYAAAPTIVVHHDSVAGRLVDEFAVEPERIHEIPHWVIPAPAAVKDLPSNPGTVLCFGALRRNKGIDDLLAAFAAVEGADIRLVIAGRGATDVEAAVRTAAARDPRIHAEIGFVPEARKHELFRACDLVVLPYETFASQSGVLHDAYAHRRPVIVTDVGALGASVRADRSGWVVAPRAPAALATAIAAALADRGAWHDAAAQAGRVAEARSPAATAERLRAVYRAAIAAGTASR